MNQNHPFLYLLCCTVLLHIFACNDPTVIGEDLLAGDQLDIEFTDTVTLHTYNMSVDSVQTYNPDIFAENFTSFPIGNFNDPVFGPTKASVVFQVTLFGSSPDFSDAVLDSVVLELPYRAVQTYGKLDEIYSIEVLELSEDLNDSLAYYSDQTFETKPDPIATMDYMPAPEDSVRLFQPRTGNFVTVPPQLRIPLDQDFSNEFFNADTLNFQTVDAFLNYFKGIHIRPVSENGGLVSFNVGTISTGIRVYFHRDTVFSDYFFPVTSANVVTAHFENDYTGTFVEDFIGSSSPLADSLLFLQGMSGINFVMEFPFAGDIENIIVNRAEIELPIEFLPFDEMVYSPIDQIIVSEILEDGSLRLIQDVTRIPQSRLSDVFGGTPESDDAYRLSISAHFQDMIRSQVTNKIMVSAYIKPEKASRVVLGGPKHALKPAKLNLTFTRY